MKCTCPARPRGARHAAGCPAAKRDTRTYAERKVRPCFKATRKAQDARRLYVGNDTLRALLDRVISERREGPASTALEEMFARDCVGPNVY